MSVHSAERLVDTHHSLAWYIHNNFVTVKGLFDRADKHLEKQDRELFHATSHILQHLHRLEADIEGVRKDTQSIFCNSRDQTRKLNQILSTQSVHTSRFSTLTQEVKDLGKSFNLSELKNQLERIENSVKDNWGQSNWDQDNQEHNNTSWGTAEGWEPWDTTYNTEEVGNQEDIDPSPPYTVQPQLLYQETGYSSSVSVPSLIEDTSPLVPHSINPLLSNTQAPSPVIQQPVPVYNRNSILTPEQREGEYNSSSSESIYSSSTSSIPGLRKVRFRHCK